MGWDKVVGAVIDLFKILLTKKRASDVFKDTAAINSITENLVSSDVSVDCCFLMMAHNGSRRLMPHGFKYRSIVGGSYVKWMMPNFDERDYQNMEISVEYSIMLSHIGRDREVDVETSGVTDRAMRSIFQNEKIKFVKYILLLDKKDAMWYLALGTQSSNEKFESSHQRSLIYLAVNKIKNIIKRY